METPFLKEPGFGLCIVLCSGCLDKIHSLGGLNNRYALKATHPRGQCWKSHYPVRAFFLVCRRPSSCYVLTQPFLCAPLRRKRKLSHISSCWYKDISSIRVGTTMTSSNFNYLCKGPSSNIVTLIVKASTYEFGGRGAPFNPSHCVTPRWFYPWRHRLVPV